MMRVSDDRIKVLMAGFTVVFEIISLILSISVAYLVTDKIFFPIRLVLGLLITDFLFVTLNVIANKLTRLIVSATGFVFLHHFIVLSFRFSEAILRLSSLSKDGTALPSFFYKIFGMKVGKNCHIGGHVFEPHMIELGDSVHIGFDAILSGHIFNDNSKKMRLSKVLVGSNVLIGGRSLIAPGARIGSNVVVGAYTFVKTGQVLDSDSVYAGIPAKKIRSLKK